ncbi:hypothetical protein MTO98_24885 [Mucilaginibacter sp. SMC90]|uniref:hypothetical protein n=1 Tax=Mucilaginibacter sp. SMC90 TaxID=2929803 RepID=UPI001FB30AFE|nr:hypothetical protein [Mucilaginibacter sp. SMC90]UOE47651.1 hypothetical protein MTO98_24885 [Mucilaginibacter sp. SMC90]
MWQAGQSILGGARGDVGKMGDKGGEKRGRGERQEVKRREARRQEERGKKSRCRKQERKRVGSRMKNIDKNRIVISTNRLGVRGAVRRNLIRYAVKHVCVAMLVV